MLLEQRDQLRQGPVTAKARAMILTLARRVVVHRPTARPRRDKSILIRLEVPGSGAELHRSVAVDGTLQYPGIGPIDRIVRAVVVCLAVQRKAVLLHRLQNVGEVGSIHVAILRCPRNHSRLGYEYLWRGGGLSEGLLGGNAVTVNVVIPRRHLARPHQEARWDRYVRVWNMRHCSRKFRSR